MPAGKLSVATLAATILLSLTSTSLNAETNPATAPVSWTPILMRPVQAPRPFESIDGTVNLVYEIVLSNFGSGPAKITELQAFDENHKLLINLSAAQLRKSFSSVGKPRTLDTILESGESAIVWVNIALKNSEGVPKELSHRLAYQGLVGNPEIKSELGGKIAVDARPPIHISAPLTGNNWIAMNCFGVTSPHRRALFPVSGDLHSTQRYAIDWIKLDDNKIGLNGLAANVKSYPAYGQPVLAVSDGTIVGVVEKFPDQVPPRPSGNKYFPGGNTITMSMPDGNYAFYAHIKPGSIRVKEGDQVTRGQVIALVGNAGNSSEPHLHFHITETADTLASNSIPYVIDDFEVVGEIPEGRKFDQDKAKGLPITLNKPFYVGQHNGQMPSEGAVISFPKQ